MILYGCPLTLKELTKICWKRPVKTAPNLLFVFVDLKHSIGHVGSRKGDDNFLGESKVLFIVVTTKKELLDFKFRALANSVQLQKLWEIRARSTN